MDPTGYRVHESKDGNYIAQKGTQLSQTCSGGFNEALCYLLLFLCNWGE